MRPARRTVAACGGLAALVLLATALCAFVSPLNPWGRVLLPLVTTAIVAGVCWPVVRRLVACEAVAEFAESASAALAEGAQSLPEPPADVPQAVQLAERLRDVLQQRREHEQQIARMIDVVREAAHGNLTKRIDVSGSNGLARLGSSVNEMIASLVTVVEQLRAAAERVGKCTSNIETVATQLASGATEQVASITQTTATTEELAASAGQIAEHAQTVVQAAERAQQSTRSAEDAIQVATNAMEKIRSASGIAAKTIGGLNERSEKIGDIISIIMDIADQTKLLSLNAAIEAARAGEAGKGFAVVAAEIRTLANNVTDSTKEIQELLVEIQKSASACVAATEEAVRQIAEGTTLVTSISDALAQIQQTIDETMQAARQIGVSTRQQQSASEQVAAAMREIAQVARESADASQRAGVAASELLDVANSLRSTVEAIQTTA